ncbi:MAG TPA: pitrilysin family protein [Polyangium sp.]|nr:pitrilysin family protein [Polyangium sp.]
MHTDSAFKAPARVRKGPFAELLNELNRDQSIHAQAEHDGSIAFGPSMRVERFVFGNGLRVLVLEDHAAPVICLQTWFGVGSRHEKEGKTGIAHLFEHLMFGETETTAHGAYDRMLEEAGAETNAATFLDWTFYHTNLPAEALELSLRLEANRMVNLVLREPQVASEKEVVANERRQRVDDDVDGAVNEMLYKEAFREHGYRHPTIGWMEDILGFTTDDCVSFYKTYYSPNNATMVIVGDVNTGRVLKLVQEQYGHVAPADIPVEDVHPEPPQIEERRFSTNKPTPTPKVAIGYKCPALGDFDHAPLLLLNEILFGGRSSRVHRELVQKLEIASEIRGYVGSFRDPGLYDVYLSAREGHTPAELLEAFDAIVDRVCAEPISEKELEKVKGRIEFGLLQGLETVSGKAEQIGFYQTVLGDPGAIFDRLALYRRVTVSDLLRVARRYLVRSARTVIEVFPDGTAGEEAADDVADDVEGDEEEEVAS